MKPKVKKIIGNICYPLAVVLLIFGVWAAAAYAKGVTLILPTPAQAFHELFAYVQTSVFWRALANSLWRSFYSFLISFALGARVRAPFAVFRSGGQARPPADGDRARGTHDGDHLYPCHLVFCVRSRPWSSRSSSSVPRCIPRFFPPFCPSIRNCTR